MKRVFSQTLFVLAVCSVLLVWVAPVAWMVLSAFKPSQLIVQDQVTLNFKPTLEHFKTIFSKQNFFQYVINSAVVSFLSALLCTLLGVFAAYSLARYKTGGRHLSFWILSTRMAPPAILIIPFYILLREIKLLDTWWGLILAYTTFNLSFVIWLMRSFFEDLPINLEEAARIDGCSSFGAFFRVALPLSRPGLIASFLFSLIYSWNEFLFALVLTVSEKSKTLPVAANDFITGYDINWGPLFASACVIILPIVLLSMALGRRLIGGLTLGAVK